MNQTGQSKKIQWIDIDRGQESKYLKHLERLKQQSSILYECVDFSRIERNACPESIVKEISRAVDFDAREDGGRGESYRTAQLNPLVRERGIRQLFNMISPGGDLKNLTPQYKVLDVLGGDGTLARALSTWLSLTSLPAILTSDLSEGMVVSAQKYGLAALRQPAQYLFLKDNCLDAVIVAYGAHHIPQNQRLLTCQEIFRVLKPGGRIVFHDFEEDSPVSRWFGEVVDPYSSTGHKYRHFTAEEIHSYLLGAGFTGVDIRYMYDPFILSHRSARELGALLGKYLRNMYGLVKLTADSCGQSPDDFAYSLACHYFQYDYNAMSVDEIFDASCIRCYEIDGLWYIEMPRVALVGSAEKPQAASSTMAKHPVTQAIVSGVSL